MKLLIYTMIYHKKKVLHVYLYPIILLFHLNQLIFNDLYILKKL